jgi:hypothetical protein
VPSLTQLTRAQAEARLDGVDLTARFDQSRADRRRRAGGPVRAGAWRLVLRPPVTVVLSAGPPAVPVSVGHRAVRRRRPGRDPASRAAARSLRAASVEVEAGQVVSQDPAGGRAQRGSTVRLVSTGPAVVAVPTCAACRSTTPGRSWRTPASGQGALAAHRQRDRPVARGAAQSEQAAP